MVSMRKWSDLADRAESAIHIRHGHSLWGLPRTNLAVISWPPTSKDKLFYRWHYWWQAHYLDCQIDAAQRHQDGTRIPRIRSTLRAMRIRNIQSLEHNRYYDDRTWLALALQRLDNVPKLRTPKKTFKQLEKTIISGQDTLTGVIPWRVNEIFYNVPTNGPAAIMLARDNDPSKLTQAMGITDWVFDNLVSDTGLIMDGVRMRMHGSEIISDLHPYCQGVMIGACLEISEKLRNQLGLHGGIETIADAEKAEQMMVYTTRLRNIVKAVSRYMATPEGVISWETGGGDAGLFKGILARYLAEVALRLPDDSPMNIMTRDLCKKMVMASAHSLWNNRLEVDGLPLFPVEWTREARLPYNSPVINAMGTGLISNVQIAERDLSVQLSGWMLAEAAAKIEKYENQIKKR